MTEVQSSVNDVMIDRFLSSPATSLRSSFPDIPQQQQHRLPNDMRERNDLYQDEEIRSMAGIDSELRNDWTKAEIAEIYDLPFHELMYRSATVHRMYWNPAEVQQCTLLSIKTGGCTEDCSYCSQSVRHKTFVKPTPTMKARI